MNGRHNMRFTHNTIRRFTFDDDKYGWDVSFFYSWFFLGERLVTHTAGDGKLSVNELTIWSMFMVLNWFQFTVSKDTFRHLNHS